MEPTEQQTEWTITLTNAERKLLCNSAQWCLIYKADVAGGKDLLKVQKLWRSIQTKLNASSFID